VRARSCRCVYVRVRAGVCMCVWVLFCWCKWVHTFNYASWCMLVLFAYVCISLPLSRYFPSCKTWWIKNLESYRRWISMAPYVARFPCVGSPACRHDMFHGLHFRQVVLCYRLPFKLLVLSYGWPFKPLVLSSGLPFKLLVLSYDWPFKQLVLTYRLTFKQQVMSYNPLLKRKILPHGLSFRRQCES